MIYLLLFLMTVAAVSRAFAISIDPRTTIYRLTANLNVYKMSLDQVLVISSFHFALRVILEPIFICLIFISLIESEVTASGIIFLLFSLMYVGMETESIKPALIGSVTEGKESRRPNKEDSKKILQTHRLVFSILILGLIVHFISTQIPLLGFLFE